MVASSRPGLDKKYLTASARGVREHTVPFRGCGRTSIGRRQSPPFAATPDSRVTRTSCLRYASTCTPRKVRLINSASSGVSRSSSRSISLAAARAETLRTNVPGVTPAFSAASVTASHSRSVNREPDRALEALARHLQLPFWQHDPGLTRVRWSARWSGFAKRLFDCFRHAQATSSRRRAACFSVFEPCDTRFSLS